MTRARSARLCCSIIEKGNSYGNQKLTQLAGLREFRGRSFLATLDIDWRDWNRKRE